MTETRSSERTPEPPLPPKYDFETMVSREGIGSMKLYCTPKVVRDAGAVSYFAAEMDFKTAPVIIEAMVERARNGLMGFTLCDERYKNAIKWWMKTQRDWDVKDDWIVPTYGTIHSVATAIRAFTEPGDGVIVQPPVYFRYEQAMRRTGRVTLMNALVCRKGRYEMDFEDLDRLMSDPKHKAKLMVLCNPHNPLGRVWAREDLLRVAELARKHNVIVFSDEIFAEIVFDGHVTLPYSEVDGAAYNCIVSTSLGKTFNFTGVNHANMIIPDTSIRERFKVQRDSDHYGSIDPMAHAALIAAYTPEGSDWVRELLKHLEGNLEIIRNFFARHLPQVRLYEVQGAYVLWIDWRGLGLPDEELQEFLVNECYLDLEPGSHYGSGGAGFTRMSFATTRSSLDKSLGLLLAGARRRGFVAG